MFGKQILNQTKNIGYAFIIILKYINEVGSNFKKKYQVLNFLPDDMFWAEKNSIGHRTNFFASRPSLCGR